MRVVFPAAVGPPMTSGACHLPPAAADFSGGITSGLNLLTTSFTPLKVSVTSL